MVVDVMIVATIFATFGSAAAAAAAAVVVDDDDDVDKSVVTDSLLILPILDFVIILSLTTISCSLNEDVTSHLLLNNAIKLKTQYNNKLAIVEC